MPLYETEMLAIQLHAFAAPVVVDLEPIGELYPRAAAQQRILGGTANVTEGDRLDRIGIRRFELHLQVLVAHDPRIDDLEISVEYGLGKTLTPRSGAAQYPGSVERKFGGREHAVRVNHAGERFSVGARGNFGRESRSERRPVPSSQAHTAGPAVAADLPNEAPRMRRNAFNAGAWI